MHIPGLTSIAYPRIKFQGPEETGIMPTPPGGWSMPLERPPELEEAWNEPPPRQVPYGERPVGNRGIDKQSFIEFRFPGKHKFVARLPSCFSWI